MRLSLLGIPVHVRPSFLIPVLGIAFINTVDPRIEPIRTQVFVGVAIATAVGVLIHELGHAIEAKRFGATPTITLFAIGGVTRVKRHRSHWKNLWVSLAGIVYQLSAAFLAYASYRWGPFPDQEEILDFAERPDVILVFVILRAFVLVNVFFAVINLVPIGGLDGGAIIEHFLRAVRVRHVGAIMFVVYAILGLAVILWSVSVREWWILIVVVVLTVAAVIQQNQAIGRDVDSQSFPDSEEEGRRLLVAGDDMQLLEWARHIRMTAQSGPYALFGANWEMHALRRLGLNQELSDLLDLVLPDLSPDVASDFLQSVGRHDDIVRLYAESAVAPEASPVLVERVACALVHTGRPADALKLGGFTHISTLALPRLIELHDLLWSEGHLEFAAGLQEALQTRSDAGYGTLIQLMSHRGEIQNAMRRLRLEIEDEVGGNGLAWLSWVFAEDGQDLESRESMANALRRGQIRDGPAIQYRLDVSDHLGLALDLGDHLLQSDHLTSDERTVVAFNHVVGLLKVRKTNEAIEALEKVDSTFLMASGIEDPDLDLLRGHPEFISLCARAEELADL